jgi:HYDIN/CFA65/VesB-like, Ig-like domain
MALRVIRMNPADAEARPGQTARVHFVRVGGPGIAYHVHGPEARVSSWCSVLVPVAHTRSGQLVIDVPADARPGRYLLRLSATSSGAVIAAGDVTLRVRERTCLRLTAKPKLTPQPDGTLVMTLRVVNCGGVDVKLVLRARHEHGWSFTVDEPELVIGNDGGPVTVKVTLRAPVGREVQGGDRVEVEVKAGDRTLSLPARLPRAHWPWLGGAAAVLLAAGLLWLGWPDPDDEVITAQPTTTVPGPSPTDPPPDPGEADLEAEPDRVDFGPITIGETAEASVTFENVGDAGADGEPHADGDAAITASSNCGEIAAGERCQVVVAFSPDVEGPVEATITVGGVGLPVTGEGLAPEPSPPEIESLRINHDDACHYTVDWEASGDPAGRLVLSDEDEEIKAGLLVESGSHEVTPGGGEYEETYTLVAYDSQRRITDREFAVASGVGCEG